MFKIKQILKSHFDLPTIIKRLNPIITGWGNFYRTVASKKTYTSMDKNLMNKLIKWACKKHPKRNTQWVLQTYLHKSILFNRNKNRFGYYEKTKLIYTKSFAETNIVRHNKITGTNSPYDGNWIYWVLRRRDISDRRLSLQKTLLSQKGRCAICKLYFTVSDFIEIDHIIPKKHGGSSFYKNLQAVHKHCHDKKKD